MNVLLAASCTTPPQPGERDNSTHTDKACSQAIRPVPAPVPEEIPVKEIELVSGRADITMSLLALVEKYSLDQVTIATKDGLVFASSGSENAQNDAAIYSGIYAEIPIPHPGDYPLRNGSREFGADRDNKGKKGTQ